MGSFLNIAGSFTHVAFWESFRDVVVVVQHIDLMSGTPMVPLIPDGNSSSVGLQCV